MTTTLTGKDQMLVTTELETLASVPLGGTFLLLAGSLDGAVRVYDPDTGDCLHEWEGHTGGVRAAGWSMLPAR